MRRLRCAQSTNWQDYSATGLGSLIVMSDQLVSLVVNNVHARAAKMWPEDKKPDNVPILFFILLYCIAPLSYLLYCIVLIPDRYIKHAYKVIRRSLCFCTTFQQLQPTTKPNKPLDHPITTCKFDFALEWKYAHCESVTNMSNSFLSRNRHKGKFCVSDINNSWLTDSPSHSVAKRRMFVCLFI